MEEPKEELRRLIIAPTPIILSCCSLSKLQKIKDAIQTHTADCCNIGPKKGVGDENLETVSAPKIKQQAKFDQFLAVTVLEVPSSRLSNPNALSLTSNFFPVYS